MKNVIQILLIIILAFAGLSCEPELESEGIARGVIRYPSILLNGVNPAIIAQGEEFNDPGAQAFLGSDDISDQLETVSTVDTDNYGVYTVSYTVSTINELDQESVVTQLRTVVVVPNNPNTSVDLSGTYTRSSNGAPATWTKVVDGLYINDNVGGVPPPSIAVLPVFVFHLDNNTVSVPTQPVPNGYGTLSAAITLNMTGYTAVVTNPFFGTGVRTFVKN